MDVLRVQQSGCLIKSLNIIGLAVVPSHVHLRCLPVINHLLLTSATLQELDNSPDTIAILLSLHYFISAKCPSVLID